MSDTDQIADYKRQWDIASVEEKIQMLEQGFTRLVAAFAALGPLLARLEQQVETLELLAARTAVEEARDLN